MRVRAKWQGRERVMQRLRKFVPDAEKEMAIAQQEAAEELAAAIRARAPIKTGEYRNSIRAEKVSKMPAQELVGMRRTKDPNAWGVVGLYIWRFLEFGTRVHSLYKGASVERGRHQDKGPWTATEASPHVFPTFRAMRRRIRRKVLGALNKAVRRVNGKK